MIFLAVNIYKTLLLFYCPIMILSVYYLIDVSQQYTIKIMILIIKKSLRKNIMQWTKKSVASFSNFSSVTSGNPDAIFVYRLNLLFIHVQNTKIIPFQ